MEHAVPLYRVLLLYLSVQEALLAMPPKWRNFHTHLIYKQEMERPIFEIKMSRMIMGKND